MRLQELLESRSADLYHGTTLGRLNRILQDNVLFANTPIHSKLIPQELRQYKNTVSLSRSSKVATDFARSSSSGKSLAKSSLPVVLVLDQAKLHAKLGRRIRPYNDMQALDTTYGDQNKPSARSRGTTEEEEAVFGNIDNINSYIKQIVIHKPNDPTKEALAELARYKTILNDPRTIVTDYLFKNLTGKQFMNLSKQKA